MGVLIGVLAFVLFVSFFIGFPIWVFRKNTVIVPRKTQWKASDKEILLLVDGQKDKHLTAKRLAKLTELSLAESKCRLFALSSSRVLVSKSSSSFKTYFSLKEEIDNRPPPLLSNNPYITSDDLFKLFKHHNYVLTLQKLCIDTGLPINVIKKELKRFIKEKIIVRLQDRFLNISYVLREPYSKEEDLSFELEEKLDLDLSKIYKKEIRFDEP